MVYVGRIRYAPPSDLPSGWWDVLQGLADWVRRQLQKAYEDGYIAGKLDALRACKEREDKRTKSSNEIEQFLAGFRLAH